MSLNSQPVLNCISSPTTVWGVLMMWRFQGQYKNWFLSFSGFILTSFLSSAILPLWSKWEPFSHCHGSDKPRIIRGDLVYPVVLYRLIREFINIPCSSSMWTLIAKIYSTAIHVYFHFIKSWILILHFSYILFLQLLQWHHHFNYSTSKWTLWITKILNSYKILCTIFVLFSAHKILWESLGYHGL